MTWQTNLIQNLLALLVLVSIFLLIYSRIKGITILEMFKATKEAFSPNE